MQFFTPQLYQQFNSLDEAEAERANEAWDQAILAYKKQLDSVRDRMPAQLIALSDLCLHDAEVIRREEITQASGPTYFPYTKPFPFWLPVWSAVAVITLRVDGEILCLFYCLWDHVRTREAPENWRFSKVREHWLYDEVQVHEESRFTTYLHSILLSTGVVLDSRSCRWSSIGSRFPKWGLWRKRRPAPSSWACLPQRANMNVDRQTEWNPQLVTDRATEQAATSMDILMSQG